MNIQKWFDTVHHKQSGLAPIAIVLIVLIIAGILILGGGIYWWQKYKISAPISTPSASTDQTANWKIYTNTKYGFEFKYQPQFIGLEYTYGTAEPGTPSGIEFRSTESPKNPFTPYMFSADELVAATMHGPWIPDQCEVSSVLISANMSSGVKITTSSMNIVTTMFTRVDIKDAHTNARREIDYIGKHKGTC